jgi:hypothetical protein
MMSLLLVPSWKIVTKIFAVCLTALGLAASSGWWMLRNYALDGTLLGQRDSLEWLRHVLPKAVVVVPWTDTERFLKFVPSHLFESLWYIGGWNQFVMPFWLNLILAVAAGVACFGVAKAYFQGGAWIRKFDPDTLLLVGCCVMAVLSVLIIARSSTQAEGRIAYVGLSSFAMLVTLGTYEFLGSIEETRAQRHSSRRRRGLVRPTKQRCKAPLFVWPVLLLAVNLYVVFRFVVPFASL